MNKRKWTGDLLAELIRLGREAEGSWDDIAKNLRARRSACTKAWKTYGSPDDRAARAAALEARRGQHRRPHRTTFTAATTPHGESPVGRQGKDIFAGQCFTNDVTDTRRPEYGKLRRPDDQRASITGSSMA